MKPYYRINHNIKVLQLYVDGANEPKQIQIDPRLDYPLNIEFVMPNDTVRVLIRNGCGNIVGLLMGSRAIQIANFSSLFDGQFNGHAVHGYLTKGSVQFLSLFCPEHCTWDKVPVARTKVSILERNEQAFKLQVKDRVGWSRSFSDIELSEFHRMFDGRFNS